MKFLCGDVLRLTSEVPWIGTEVNNLPTFDGLNHLETFLMEFEEIVPVQQRLLALDGALKENAIKMVGNTQEEHHRLGAMSHFDDSVIFRPRRRV
jgi:hypothetical protein